MKEKFPRLYLALKTWNWRLISKHVARGEDINCSMVSRGPQAGYTALHLAVMEKDSKCVEKLIQNYGANVNSVGTGGAKPIHLACIRGSKEIAEVLIKFGADVDTEFTGHFVEAYNWEWSDDFEGKITLLTFAIMKNYKELAQLLLEHQANFRVKDNNNKTLLMYATENDYFRCVTLLIKYMKDEPDLIDARDDDGKHVLHYLLPRVESTTIPYGLRKLADVMRGNIVKELIEAGVDVNAMINGDPDTLIINMAVHECDYEILSKLFSLDVPFSDKARPLYYFTLFARANNCFQVQNENEFEEMEFTLKKTVKCVKIILQYLSLRRELRIFVPEEEMILINKLVDTCPEVKMFLTEFQEEFFNIRKVIKIDYGNESISNYDLAVMIFNSRSLKLLVKNEELVEACKEFFCSPVQCQAFNVCKAMNDRITRAYQCRKLMEQVETISQLRKFIPLPYELVLMIIEYVNNKDLENFIKAFYQNPTND